MHYSLTTSLPQRLLHASLFITLAACSLMALAKGTVPAQDEVTIENAWVRPTNAGQDVGAAYMTLVSNSDVSLVHVESSVTKSVEIHSMTMQKGVMKMRMLESLPLNAGKPYKLEPGGFHLMLFDLKKPLMIGEQVTFELTFKTKKNVEFKQTVTASVKNATNNTENNNDHNHGQNH